MLYDLFAARYGYDLNKFYSLTMRQIYELKSVIEIKNHEEREFQAQLHNKKTQGAPKRVKVSKKMRDEYDTQALSLLERMRKKHQDGSRITDKD